MKKVCFVLAWLAYLPFAAMAGPEDDEFVPATLEELKTAVAAVRAPGSRPGTGCTITPRAMSTGCTANMAAA